MPVKKKAAKRKPTRAQLLELAIDGALGWMVTFVGDQLVNEMTESKGWKREYKHLKSLV
jgi:hypothetical protein